METLRSSHQPSAGHFPEKSRHAVAGFSLVEVTLALGILSFAFVTLLGLIPIGLGTFRESVDRSVSTEIAQRIINEARQTDFATLTALGASDRYFTDEGDETTETSLTRIYVARTAISNEVPVPSGELAFVNTSMAEIQVQVAHQPNRSATDAAGDLANARFFHAFIPKM